MKVSSSWYSDSYDQEMKGAITRIIEPNKKLGGESRVHASCVLFKVHVKQANAKEKERVEEFEMKGILLALAVLSIFTLLFADLCSLGKSRLH